MKKRRGAPTIDPKDRKDQRFQFVFSTRQVEVLGGREKVFEYVKDYVRRKALGLD